MWRYCGDNSYFLTIIMCDHTALPFPFFFPKYKIADCKVLSQHNIYDKCRKSTTTINHYIVALHLLVCTFLRRPRALPWFLHRFRCGWRGCRLPWWFRLWFNYRFWLRFWYRLIFTSLKKLHQQTTAICGCLVHIGQQF